MRWYGDRRYYCVGPGPLARRLTRALSMPTLIAHLVCRIELFLPSSGLHGLLAEQAYRNQ